MWGILANFLLSFRSICKQECQSLMYEASDVADDIQSNLKKEDYSESEVVQFKALIKKARALENYIGAVGSCSNVLPTIEQFYLANKMVGGTIGTISKEDFCIDFISVTINKYFVVLSENNTNENYKVSYNWKIQGSSKTGNGIIGLSSKSLRSVYDNRENLSQKSISFNGVICNSY
jgi:hypothetical protein